MWFFLAFAVGMVLQKLSGLGLPEATGFEWLGTLLANAGLLLSLWCIGLFQLSRTTLSPPRLSSGLVTTGPYGFSRNPMYVAVTLVHLGLGLMYHQHIALLLLSLPLLLLNTVIIPFEERRLSQLFGDAYIEYCQRVDRWL